MNKSWEQRFAQEFGNNTFRIDFIEFRKQLFSFISQELGKAYEIGRKSTVGLENDEGILFTMYELDELRAKLHEEGRQKGYDQGMASQNSLVQEERTRILKLISEMDDIPEEISAQHDINLPDVYAFKAALESLKSKIEGE